MLATRHDMFVAEIQLEVRETNDTNDTLTVAETPKYDDPYEENPLAAVKCLCNGVATQVTTSETNTSVSVTDMSLEQKKNNCSGTTAVVTQQVNSQCHTVDSECQTVNSEFLPVNTVSDDTVPIGNECYTANNQCRTVNSECQTVNIECCPVSSQCCPVNSESIAVNSVTGAALPVRSFELSAEYGGFFVASPVTEVTELPKCVKGAAPQQPSKLSLVSTAQTSNSSATTIAVTAAGGSIGLYDEPWDLSTVKHNIEERFRESSQSKATTTTTMTDVYAQPCKGEKSQPWRTAAGCSDPRVANDTGPSYGVLCERPSATTSDNR